MLTREKHRHVADITLHARGEQFLHGARRVRQLGDVAHPGDRQDRAAGAEAEDKQKDKRHGAQAPRRRRRAARADRRAARAAQAGRGGTASARPRGRACCARRDEAIKPMSVDDAAREVEAGGDGVVVFRELPTRRPISVLYRRRERRADARRDRSLIDLRQSRRMSLHSRRHASPALLSSRPEAFGLPLELLAGGQRPRSRHHQPAHPEDRARARRLPRVPQARARPDLRRERDPLSREPRAGRAAPPRCGWR